MHGQTDRKAFSNSALSYSALKIAYHTKTKYCSSFLTMVYICSIFNHHTLQSRCRLITVNFSKQPNNSVLIMGKKQLLHVHVYMS